MMRAATTMDALSETKTRKKRSKEQLRIEENERQRQQTTAQEWRAYITERAVMAEKQREEVWVRRE